MNPADLDWALWRSFLAILREGSLSGAARVLHVAHPTVRRHLDDLETRLGSALFVRSPSGLAATDLALSLREGAETMEAAAALLVRTASVDASAVGGTVRITASEIMGVEVLPLMLATLRTKYPDLAFELSLTNTVEDVLRHDADIAIRMTPPTQGDLLARKIGQVPLGLYAHESWIGRHGPPESFAALIAAGALIGYDRNSALLRAFAASGVQVTRANFGFRSDSDLAQLAALRAGFGVGFCQRPIAARDSLLRNILPDLVHRLDIWLVTHPNLRAVNRVRATWEGLFELLTGYVTATEAADNRPDRMATDRPTS